MITAADLLVGSGSKGGARDDAMARMLLQQGLDTSPIQSPFQGLARLAQAYVGKGMLDKSQSDYQSMLGNLLGQNQINPVGVTAPVAGPGAQAANLPGATPMADPTRQAAYAAPTESYSGPLGKSLGNNAGAMAALLQGLPADEGQPLLTQTIMGQMQRQQGIDDRRITPMSQQDATARGLRPGGSYGTDISNNSVVIQPSDMKSSGAIQQANDQARIVPITDPNDPGLPPPNARPPGAMYGRNAAGNVVEILKGDAKSQIAESQAQAERAAAMKEQMAMLGGGTPSPIDPASGSLQGQTGLSQAAINFLTTGQAPRGQAAYMSINNEIDNWAKKNGVNTATLKAQAKGYNDILTNNLQRNNQGKILENEIQGTIQNLAPMSDAINNGTLKIGNVISLWAGKEVNDPAVLQYKDQLLRLQQELAGYNAVAGGKLTEQGTARVDEGDMREAASVLSNGINSGGLKGLGDSIAKSTGKNRAVLGTAIDDANQNMWGLFGVGKNYKRQNDVAPQGATPAGVPPNWVLHVDAKGNKAYVSPDGKQFKEVP